MKKFIYTSLLMSLMILFSCQDLVDGIDDNPNDITISDVDPSLFLTGAQLANTSMANGHLNRIAGMWSGQLTGLSSLYSNIYGYSMSTAESVGTWGRIYIGIIPNVRHIREQLPNDALMQGISKVLEAQAVGLGASLFGDVPYSQVNQDDIDDPAFDNQIDVLNAVIALLDSAIGDLTSAGSGRSLDVDIYYEGDATKWREAANTLKARYLMIMRDYSGAYAAALNGISSASGNMQHIPRGDASVAAGDKNLFWEILEGSRTGDIGSTDSYLAGLLDPSSDTYRGNAKTDETARSAYSFVDASGANNNGIIEQFEPQNIVSFEENHLILAEAGARTSGFDTGLGHLNEFRAWLNTGGRLNSNFTDMPYLYEAYEAADFDAGGMENSDGIAVDRALLREIIEERYISGFGEFMPYDDARRLRKGENDIAVPFPLNVASASAHPERMPYSDDELNSNSNAPSADPGIFTKTRVNM